MNNDPQAAIDHLVRILKLRRLAHGIFEARTEQDEGRLFGGLILAQAVMACGSLVEDGDIHSLHAYFLRAGKPAKNVTYMVERVRDGRNFTTRRVSALQDEDMIFEATISYVRPEEGISFQEPMPAAPDPEAARSWWETMVHEAPAAEGRSDTGDSHGDRHGRLRRTHPNPIDIRAAGASRPGSAELPRRAVWGRPAGPLPEDPHVHAAALAYFSDSGLVATVAQHYGSWQPGGATASLDHTMWFHRAPRFDDWVLYTSYSPAAHAARAVIFAGMYGRDGTRIASVAQEGLFRAPR